jgi:hypothetical protein
MTMNSKRWLVIAVLSVAMVVLGLVLPMYTRAEKVENLSVTTDIDVFIPCAKGGAGELVTLSGYLHVLIQITENNGGGFHVKTHFQPQGISGVGTVTGDKYQATGVTQDELNVAAGVEETFINNFRIIGQGPGNNLLIHETFHITINANGDVTVFVDNVSAECK